MDEARQILRREGGLVDCEAREAPKQSDGVAVVARNARDEAISLRTERTSSGIGAPARAPQQRGASPRRSVPRLRSRR